MTPTQEQRKATPWAWIPTLYFAQGIPYVVAMTVSVIFYKRMGVSNSDIALYTSWLYLPWVIKPLWSPLIELIGTKRRWILGMQLFVGAALAMVALTIPGPAYFRTTLLIFWLLAFCSSTHDIAADGYYMLSLSKHEQAWFVGIRSTFYRLAMISGQGLLVMLAGWLEKRQTIPMAWSACFFVIAAGFFLVAGYHSFVLPKPAVDRPTPAIAGQFWSSFFETFLSFFRKPGIGVSLAFLLLYRFAEAQLVKMASPFLLEARDLGGLGLETASVGFVYGTVGVIALTCGGLLGGFLAARDGLKRWLWPMVLAINVPNLVYVYLAWARPESFLIINLCVACEQFGYGFGFAAYLLYMIYIAEGEQKTAHYALCTGFMALGMMLPGMFSGHLQEWMGYRAFFVWIVIATLPGFLVTSLIRIDPSFGKKAPPS